MTMRSLLVAAAIAAVVPSLSAQTTTTIVVDKDTILYESAAGTLANGGGTTLFAGLSGQPKVRRTLLHFDVASAIPAGSRVLSARLEVHVISVAAPNPMAAAHRVTQAWSEGTTVAPGGQGSGGTAQNGDATWLHTDYPNSLWNTPGGDFDGQPSFSMPLTTGSSVSSPFAGLIGDVQSWLDAPANNFGWLLMGDEATSGGAAKLFSRESANSTNHARLILSYLMPGEVAAWGTGCPVGAGTMNLALSGIANGGVTIPLSYSNAPLSSIGATYFALDLAPAGVELFSSCSVYLPLAGTIVSGAIFSTDASGNGADSFTVPAGFPGFLVACQGAVLDGTPSVFALSNAGVMLTQ
ncbi:MAG: hypothetical protein ACI9SE_001038 [Neolewinella sp.]|jgi:hypothetical protein